MTKKIGISFILVSLLILAPLELHSEFYKYVDKSGITHFVDNISKIPIKYRDGSEFHEQKKYDHLSNTKRQGLLEREKQRREAMIAEYASKELETKVAIINNSVLVPVRLGYGGREIKTVLVLDTGATVTLLHQEVARKLGIRNMKKTTGRVADGKTITAGMAKLDYIIVGPFKRKNLDVAVVKHQGPSGTYNGLLGMNFLRNIEYSIDFDRNVIKWKKP